MKRADAASIYNSAPCSDESLFFSGFAGSSAMFGAAHPTEDSRGDAACGKIMHIASDSFLHRPSLCDEAVNSISGFINRDIYSLQEPYRAFLAHSAIVFIHKKKARCIFSGNGRIYHLSGGKVIGSTEQREYLLYGKKIRYKENFAPEFDLARGDNSFVICCGNSSADIEADVLESIFASSVSAEEAAQKLGDSLPGNELSVMTVKLPERKSLLGRLFGGGR